MKAVVCKNAKLSVTDLPDPKPGTGQVLVNVIRCGICGSDLHMRHHCNHMKSLLRRVDGDAFSPTSKDSVVFGHEFCCEIIEYGPGCKKKLPIGTMVVSQPILKIGDKIDFHGMSHTTTGAYAERMLLQESLLEPVPNGLSPDLAALTEPMAIAWHAIRRSDINRKDVAIIIGCGPVGLAVVCALKAIGVRTIIATDYSPGRRDLARKCGADVVLDPAENSPYSSWEEHGFIVSQSQLLRYVVETKEKLAKLPLPWWQAWRIGEALGKVPNGPVIFECVGLPGLLQNVINDAPMMSRIVVVGVCMQSDKIEPALALMKEVDLRFTFGHSPLEFRDTLHMIANGKIECGTLITGEVSLYGVEKAFDTLNTPELHAKILVNPQSTGKNIIARS